jgi:hypothetical protein
MRCSAARRPSGSSCTPTSAATPRTRCARLQPCVLAAATPHCTRHVRTHKYISRPPYPYTYVLVPIFLSGARPANEAYEGGRGGARHQAVHGPADADAGAASACGGSDEMPRDDATPSPRGGAPRAPTAPHRQQPAAAACAAGRARADATHSGRRAAPPAAGGRNAARRAAAAAATPRVGGCSPTC